MDNEMNKSEKLDRIVSINAVIGIPIACVIFAVWCFIGGFYYNKVVADIIYYGLIIYIALSFIFVIITTFLRARHNKKKLIGFSIIMILFVSMIGYFIYKMLNI